MLHMWMSRVTHVMHEGCCRVLQCVAVRCSVLQCVAVCCSVLQCVAACCSVLQKSCNTWDACKDTYLDDI